MNQKIVLDGSQGEGGGSILRVAAGLACVKSNPLSVINIRKNRDNPGLRPQHLIGIQALNELSSGSLSKVEVGTMDLEFTPGSNWKDRLNLTIPTAGNIGLLMQTLHNSMYQASIPSLEIFIHGGGTYGMAAPGTAFVQNITYSLFHRLGYDVALEIIKHGFYPRGGAEARAIIKPNPGNYKGLILEERGRLERIHGHIFVEQSLQKAQVAERINKGISQHIKADLVKGAEIQLEISYLPTLSVGVGVDVWCEFSLGAVLGCGTILGERGVSSEAVGKKVASKINLLLDSEATVDEYTSDQLVPLLVFSKEPSKFRLDTISSHFQTNLDIIKYFNPREYRITKLSKGFTFEYL